MQQLGIYLAESVKNLMIRLNARLYGYVRNGAMLVRTQNHNVRDNFAINSNRCR